MLVFLENHVDAFSDVLSDWNLGALVKHLEQLVLLGRNVNRGCDLAPTHKEMVPYMAMRRRGRFLPLIACSVIACSGASSNPVAMAQRAPREFDIDRDGRPEIFEFGAYRQNDPNDTKSQRFFVTRREMDINRDGKIDIIRTYDGDEKLVREEFDLDFDSKYDAVSIYEKGVLVRQEIDQNFDGRYESVRFYERGKLVRREVDETGKGKPTRYEYFENGELDRIGIDSNGDGTVERWEQARKASSLPTGAP